MAKQQNNVPFTQRLALYSVAAGAAAVGVPDDAEAVVTAYVDNQTITVTNATATYNIDINNDATDDFQLSITDSATPGNSRIDLFSLGSNQIHTTSAPGATCPGSGYAGFIAGGTVGPALNFGTGSQVWRDQGCSNWPLHAMGYLGVYFQDTMGGNFHYGYIQFERQAGSTIGIISGGAYETGIDTAINAAPHMPLGAAAPAAVGLLAIGAAALRRRRRKLN